MKEAVTRSNCPISYSLDFLGDRWSFLLIRDMILDDKTTFGEFLDSAERIATNILTARLKRLEAEGFVLKYPLEGKVRTGYCLTPKGIDLIPVIVEMALWGVKYSGYNPRKALTAALHQDKEGTIKTLMSRLTEKYQTLQQRVQP